MTANLLAHAPHLFCCGVARSGAYNRTLTPFGFQVDFSEMSLIHFDWSDIHLVELFRIVSPSYIIKVLGFFCSQHV